MGSSHVTWSLSYDKVMDERFISMAEIWRRQRENREHSSGDIKSETESTVVETLRVKQKAQ